MSGTGHPSALVTILIGALIAWRFYKRIRRLVVRQRLSTVRPWITVCVFPVLLALLALSSFARPLVLLAMGGGIAAGIALGIYGLRLTRFEQTATGLYYTPSAHLGIALSALLVLRLGYRAVQVYFSSDPSGAAPGAPGVHTTPTTLLIFGALAGYYVTYAVGLIRWRRSVDASAVPLPSPNPER